MAHWHCRGCSATYSVGATSCPHCGSTDVNDGEAPVAKITETGVSHTPGEEPEGWEPPLPGPDDTEPTDDIEVSADGDSEQPEDAPSTFGNGELDSTTPAKPGTARPGQTSVTDPGVK